MNRPIKFRIWNSNAKQWENPSKFATVLSSGDTLESTSSQAAYSWKEPLWAYEIHQFTNALDKNNRQIFEGDIVLYENPDPYDNETLLVKIVGYNSRVMGFRLYNFSHEINKSGGTSFFPEEVKVIGNIFEGASKDGVDYGKWLVEK